MPYQLNPGEPPSEAVRRIIVEEATAAAQGLRSAGNRDEAVHEARKSVKKARALLRLYGKALGPAASAENTRLRSLGRKLSAVRDAHAMLEVVETLRKDGGGPVLDRVERHLRAQMELAQAGGVAGAAAPAFERLARRAAHLTVRSEGFESVERGLERGFRRGRKALAAARKDATDEAFHEWRKAAKEHWYHVRLLGGMIENKLEDREKQLADLCDWLGDDHNLAVLRGLIAARPRAYGAAREVARFVTQLGERQAKLRERALEAGERLYDRKPKKFVRLVAALWKRGAANTAAA